MADSSKSKVLAFDFLKNVFIFDHCIYMGLKSGE
jgi:hypothetical protein